MNEFLKFAYHHKHESLYGVNQYEEYQQEQDHEGDSNILYKRRLT